MSELTAYGLVVLSSALVTAIIWAVAWKRRKWQPLGEHTAYIAGWEACSRIRDREDVQARKEKLLARSVHG